MLEYLKKLCVVMLAGLCAAPLSALADARTDFKVIFGDEAKKVTASEHTADDAIFAAKLLKRSADLKNSPELRLLIYEKVYAFGIENPIGYAPALQAVELLAKALPDRAAEWQEKKFKVVELRFTASRGETRRAAGKGYLDMLLAMAESHVAKGDIAKANDLYIKALPIATFIKSPRIAEVTAKRREMTMQIVAARKHQEKIEFLHAKLAKNPKDRATREELIVMYVLDEKPAEAVKLLTDDVDEQLRTYVPLAAKPVEQVPESAYMGLGAWYQQIAKNASGAKKIAALRRAEACYKRYLALHTKQDASALKAKMALRDVEDAIAAALATRPAKQVKTTKEAEQKVTVVVMAASRWTRALKVSKGQILRIEASGEWKHRPKAQAYDADGDPNEPDGLGKLQGLIGKTTYIIGKSCVITVEEDGDLQLSMKDPRRIHDNKGSVTVRITVAPKPK